MSGALVPACEQCGDPLAGERVIVGLCPRCFNASMYGPEQQAPEREASDPLDGYHVRFVERAVSNVKDDEPLQLFGTLVQLVETNNDWDSLSKDPLFLLLVADFYNHACRTAPETLKRAPEPSIAKCQLSRNACMRTVHNWLKQQRDAAERQAP